jgi:hypothetical protein
MKTCGHLPVISQWLYRLDVWRTVRRATMGDVPAVCELTAVFCTSPDPKSRDLAGRGLAHLWLPEQIDLLCHESLLWDNDILTTLATGCGYLPAAPARRALWLFCTSPVSELRRANSGIHLPLLSSGYWNAELAVRVRALDAARRNRTDDILGPALAGPDITRNAAIWSFGEWEVVIRGFSGLGRWDDLWLLVSLAPLTLAMEAVRSLKAAGWSPQGDDRPLWQDLARDLPDHGIPPLCAGEPRLPVGRPAGQVARLCFSPDGSLLGTGCCDGMISVWRTAAAGLATEFPAVAGSVRFLAIPAGNACLVSAGDDATIVCHRLGDRTLLWSWKGRGEGVALALSPDGRTVLVGDSEGRLHVLDILDGRVLYTLILHPVPVTCLTPAPEGPVVACGHADGTVSVIRPGDGSGPLILPGTKSPVLAISISSSGTECLAVYERGHPVRWDLSGRKKICTYTGHTGRRICSAVPADGWFAVVSDDHSLRCWDLTRPEPAAVIPAGACRGHPVLQPPDHFLLGRSRWQPPRGRIPGRLCPGLSHARGAVCAGIQGS